MDNLFKRYYRYNHPTPANKFKNAQKIEIKLISLAHFTAAYILLGIGAFLGLMSCVFENIYSQ